MNDLRIYDYNQNADLIESERYVENTNGIAYNAVEFAAGNHNMLYVADEYNIYQ